MTEVAISDLMNVSGGAGPQQSWEDIRAAAAPHCPRTAARFTREPRSRAEAQQMGNACIAEMGSFKADVMGGRRRINSAIDQRFPR